MSTKASLSSGQIWFLFLIFYTRNCWMRLLRNAEHRVPVPRRPSSTPLMMMLAKGQVVPRSCYHQEQLVLTSSNPLLVFSSFFLIINVLLRSRMWIAAAAESFSFACRWNWIRTVHLPSTPWIQIRAYTESIFSIPGLENGMWYLYSSQSRTRWSMAFVRHTPGRRLGLPSFLERNRIKLLQGEKGQEHSHQG